MKVMNMLQTRAYKLGNEEKVPIIKKVARKGRTAIHTNIYKFQKRYAKTVEGWFKYSVRN